MGCICSRNRTKNKTFTDRLPPPSTSPPDETRTYGITTNHFVIATHNFVPTGPSQLTFVKGDKFEISAKPEADWWRGRLLRTNEEGYIPVAYTVPLASLQSEDWYFGEVSREECEAMLMSSVNPIGSFLVRDTDKDSDNHKHSLSVKIHRSRTEGSVKHYRIFVNRQDFYFISIHSTYATLNDLVEAQLLKKDPGVVSYTLTVPCRKPAPVINYLRPSNEWDIPESHIHFEQTIGKGNFSEVWLGKCYNTSVAIKKLMPESSMSKKDFMEEAAIMKDLKHKNIVVLFGVCTTSDHILIITEFMSNGSLIDFLRKDENQFLQTNSKISFAQQVASGMLYLERKQLIHRDLAARNVLVGDSMNCKISDFGLARVLHVDSEYTTSGKLQFALKWTAPEAYLKFSFSIKSDVWSFGILCYEIFTNGEVPYPGFSLDEVIARVKDGYRMPKPGMCPDEIYNVMISCWNIVPKKRPTFEFLLQQLQNFIVYAEVSYYTQPPQQ